MPEARTNQAFPTGINAGGPQAHVWLEGALRPPAVNVVTPNFRERAGGSFGSLARPAALGSERGCCWGPWQSWASRELGGSRGVAGWCGRTAELPMTSALGRCGGSPDLSKKGCHVEAERLKDVFLLLLTIIQYFLKTTSGCIFR